MSNMISLRDTQLPAHLQGMQPDSTTSSLATQKVTFPKLIISGKQFAIRSGGEERLLRLQEVEVIIVAAMPLGPIPSKIFYRDKYVEGSNEAPDCMSSDGIRPDARVPDPQSATTCAVCPQNAWGSSKSMTGADSKACRDMKHLYLITPSGEDGVSSEIVQLVVPTMSLKTLTKYASELSPRRISVSAVKTVLSFTDDKYPALNFRFGGFLSEAQYNATLDVIAGDTVSQILSGATSDDYEPPSASVIPETPDYVAKGQATAKSQPQVMAKPQTQEETLNSDFLDDILKSEEATVAKVATQPAPELPEVDDSEDEEVDSDGRIWDERIDSSNRRKTAKGQWMRRKNVAEDTYIKIRNTLLGASSTGTAEAAPVAAVPKQQSFGSVFDAPAKATPAAAASPVQSATEIDVSDIDRVLAELGCLGG